MTKKQKRATIGNEQEEAIAQFVSDFRNMSRIRLAEKIQAEVKWPGKPPEIEVLERKISHYRKGLNRPDREDQPWSIGTPSDYSISPEALPTVFAVCKYARDKGNVFTIRQAKWAARLSGVLRDQSPSKLWEWTTRYAGVEIVSRLLDRPLDTLSLDAQLIGVEADQWTKEQLAFRFQETAVRLRDQLEGREQSRPKYPPAIWEQENDEQSKDQNKTKRQIGKRRGRK